MSTEPTPGRSPRTRRNLHVQDLETTGVEVMGGFQREGTLGSGTVEQRTSGTSSAPEGLEFSEATNHTERDAEARNAAQGSPC